MKQVFTTPFEVEVGGAPLEGGLSPRSALETIRQASKTSYELITRSPVTFFVVPFLLFVLLAPAYLLSLPKQSEDFCFANIPLSTGSTHQASCVSSTTSAEKTANVASCAARAKCQKYWNPMGVDHAPVWVHAAVFTVVLAIVQRVAYAYFTRR
jgi:hypothetical protein